MPGCPVRVTRELTTVAAASPMPRTLNKITERASRGKKPDRRTPGTFHTSAIVWRRLREAREP